MGQSYIGKIVKIDKIENADRIMSAEVICGNGGRWCGVVDKTFSVDDRCVVFLPDSIVPVNLSIMFMEKSKWIVKQKRFRGARSEVLITKLNIWLGLKHGIYLVGDCIDINIGTKKYEKPILTSMSGDIVGGFPAYVPKTDELNFQKAEHIREYFTKNKTEVYITVKADGTSLTVANVDGETIGCSINNTLSKDYNIGIWKIIKKYDLENKLKEFGNIAIQMEGVGPKIQKNPLSLKELEPRVFNVYDISNRKYYGYHEAIEIVKKLGMPFVDVLEVREYDFDDELQTYTDGIMYNGTKNQIEGVVIRSTRELIIGGDRSSFKVISLKYKG